MISKQEKDECLGSFPHFIHKDTDAVSECATKEIDSDQMDRDSSDIFFIAVDGIEDEVLEELVEMFEGFHMKAEEIALKLEATYFDSALILSLKYLLEDVLFQSIKLNLTPFSESLEESVRVLDKLLLWKAYPERMSEVLLLINDRMLVLVRDLFSEKTIDIRKTQQILVSLQHIILVVSLDCLDLGIEQAILTITQSASDAIDDDQDELFFQADNDNDNDNDVELFAEDNFQHTAKEHDKIDIFIPNEINNPLLKAREYITSELTNNAVKLLIQISDESTDHNTSHTDFLLELCLACNFLYGSPVNEKSLSTGICFHDIAMAANASILAKKEALSADEIDKLRQHPIDGVSLLHMFDQSEESKLTVLQHHERFNGSGYPYQTKGSEICDGAKILGIVDSFHGMISDRPHKKYSKDILRAISEINACVDTHYDPDWVKIFNDCLRKYWLPMNK